MAWQYHIVGWRNYDDDGVPGWHPDIPDDVTMAALDLRPVALGLDGKPRQAKQQDGFCLLATHDDFNELPVGAIKIADGPGVLVPRSVINQIGNRLGISIDPATRDLGTVLFQVTQQGSLIDDAKWNPIAPTNGKGRLEMRGGKRMAIRERNIFLGQRLFNEEFSSYEYNGGSKVMDDSFEDMSSGQDINGHTPDILAPGTTWIRKGPSDWKRKTSGGELEFSSNGDWMLIDLSMTDGKILWEYSGGGTNQDVRGGCRMDSGYANGYEGDLSVQNNRLRWREYTGGSPTTMASETGYTLSNSVTHTFGASVDGSDLKLFDVTPVDDDPPQSGAPFNHSDGTHTTGDYWGHQGQNRTNNNHRLNRSFADDLAVVGGFPEALFGNNPNTLLRM